MDYFEELFEFLISNNLEVTKTIEFANEDISSILGYSLSNKVKQIYDKYSFVNISWSGNTFNGNIDFVPYLKIQEQHQNLIAMIGEIYDYELDEYSIKEDIYNWYPLFKFTNGDMFCLDARDGTVKFFEHDVIDCGPNLHGLLIALSIDELFEKWSKIHFSDVYYWDECVDENGLNLNSDRIKNLF